MLLSPPSRRRGLKSGMLKFKVVMEASPPSRRRGLKFKKADAEAAKKTSPPSRRRGLKFHCFPRLLLSPGRLLLGGVD